MKIIKAGDNEITFKSLKWGDVFFIDSGNGYYMKTYDIDTEFDGVYNAVDIQNGEYATFELEDLVEKVDCELVIK